MSEQTSEFTDYASLPPASRNFTHDLVTLPAPPPAAGGPSIGFVYKWSMTDRTYDSNQYPVSGVFSGTTTPWLNELDAVPASWQWTALDTHAQKARAKQVKAQMVAMNPPGGYTGTTAEQISQRYSTDMWAASVFPADQLDRLQVWIDDDAEFARQRLGGANTNVIRSAADFDVTAWIQAATNAAALTDLQATLLAAQETDGLFVCDYTPVLGSVVTNQFVQNNAFLAAPICLLTVESGALQPKAIQIVGTDANSYIFTPGDTNDPNGDAWLLAKLWVANADLTWWFSGSHLYNTHSIDMIFGIAALEQIAAGTLAEDHPIVILAKPHLVKSFNINTAVYNMKVFGGIYQVGQFCDQVLPTGRIGIYEIITNLYSDYEFASAGFDQDLQSRGLDSGPIAGVSFPYRDDGQVWWEAIETFVGTIVEAYADDDAVKSDVGLNAWMNSVQTAFNQDGNSRFTWTPTKDGLTSICTNLVFLCSVQHCSVNNSMFNSWAFTPNGPFSMQQAPPVDATSVTQQTVLDTLPNPTPVDGKVSGSDGRSSPATDMHLVQNQVTFVMNGTAAIPGQKVVSEFLAGTGTEASLEATYPYAPGSAQASAVSAFYNAIWTGAGSVKTTICDQEQTRIAAYQNANPGKPVPNTVSYYYLTAEAEPSMYLNAPATSAIQI